MAKKLKSQACNNTQKYKVDNTYYCKIYHKN